MIFNIWCDVLSTYCFELLDKNLQKIYILTSVDPDGESPSPDSDKWMFRYYHQDPYGSVGNIRLEQGVPSRYVAVFCAHNKGLAIAEIKMYSFSKFILGCATC